MDNSSIKDNIRKFRKSHNLTQEEMAHKLGLSLTAYRDFESGKTAVVNTHIIKMAEMLDTSAEELVLGYRPVQAPGRTLEDVRSEYGSQIHLLEKRIGDLEKLVASLEETIVSKNEIILMLKKRLGEVD